jgi:hypothetical protein
MLTYADVCKKIVITRLTQEKIDLLKGEGGQNALELKGEPLRHTAMTYCYEPLRHTTVLELKSEHLRHAAMRA